jgi:hypothetical protein
MFAALVTIAKFGTVQLLVNSGLWENETLVGCSPLTVSHPKSESVLPVRVLRKGFEVVAVVVVGAEVKVETANTLAVASTVAKLDSENGEQPTKPGAVSPTDSHSCWLNRIASARRSALGILRVNMTYWTDLWHHN